MRTLLSRALELILGSAAGPIGTEDDLSRRDRLGSPPVFSFSPSRRLTKILRHKGYTHLRRFAVIPSCSVPRWILPIGDVNETLAGTQIYLPHKWAPRAIKGLFAATIKMGWNGSLGSQILIASKGPLHLETLVGAVTGEYNPVLAWSLGRRLAVRKLTVQVMRPNGEILGYMKLPLTEAATERVRHEAIVLERLWNFPTLRPHIPQLLHAGAWNGSYILFQSVLPGEPGPTNLTRLHENLLQTLWDVNRIERPGQSLVDEVGAKWDKAVVLLGSKWKEMGQEVLRRSAQDLDRLTIRCGISHGDFAPWNTRAYQERLLLFDWESTQWQAPTSWDSFHFGLQTAVSLKKKTCTTLPIEHTGGATYWLFLLSSVIQFLQEENWAAIDYRRKVLTRDLEQPIYIRTDELVPKTQVVRSIDRQLRERAPMSVLREYPGPRIVTTSWDDGDPRDARIAELLRSRGIAGTFYIPMLGYANKTTLATSDLRALSSEGFEIGAHSVSHNSLTTISEEQLRHEVSSCKQTLEQTVGKEVSMFCYPNGRYNHRVIHEVRRAGYKGARTTWMLSTSTDFRPFEMPTTLQAFPHRRTGYLRDLGRAKNIYGLWKFTTEQNRFESWIDLGKKLFSQVLQYGGIWHLYGHSWEIDDLAIWGDLREMLDHVSHHKDVTYVTNGQLCSLLNGCTRAGPPTATATNAQWQSYTRGKQYAQ
jgi:peptidoglycan/xylan/chitin deacetylase (PgdA/CDA1 family)